MQYKCSIVRQKDVDLLITNLTQINTNGSIKYKVKVLYSFSEKIMTFILKQIMSTIGLNMYEGSYEDIKKVLDITVKIEKMLIENSKDLDVFSDMLDGIKLNTEFHIDPTEPTVHKAKIQIDQINNLTGEVIATFNSLEEAGKSVGCTGTAIGIANRTKRVCKGFRWRPTGVSKEQQYDDQPVIKVCCSTGKQTLFSTIADAAKDAIISAPGLRSRILTKVHTNGHHWIFGKNASHYFS